MSSEKKEKRGFFATLKLSKATSTTSPSSPNKDSTLKRYVQTTTEPFDHLIENEVFVTPRNVRLRALSHMRRRAVGLNFILFL